MTGMAEMAMRPILLLPEGLLFLGGLVALLGGSFLPRQRQWVTRVVAAVALVAAAVAAGVAMTSPAQTAFEGTFTVDVATGVARIAAVVGTLIVLALASDEISGSRRESETYALLLFTTTGVLVVAGASDLLVLAVGFLLASIPLYGLIGIERTPLGAEAVLKTYLVGAMFGILLLAGITVLYGVTATTSYAELTGPLGQAPTGAVAAGVVAVVTGLMFKAGGVPGHFWVPDAAQGAGGAVAAFLTTVPKIGAVVATYRLIDLLPDTTSWPALVAVLAVASMTLGNLAAYWQEDPRRLLGWSTVSQVGYLLVPVAAAGASDLARPSMLLYLAGYTVTNLAAFAVTSALPDRRTLDSYRGLASTQPALAAVLVVALLGLVGTPPTVVFVGKLTTTAAAWDAGLPLLVVAVFLNTLISLFYYLRWIVPVFDRRIAADHPSRPARHDEDHDHHDDRAAGTSRGRSEGSGSVSPLPSSWMTAVVTAVLSLVLGVGTGLYWQVLTGA